MRSNSYCLVLSGGGAKGVYHVGVWKALREMGIKVDAFVGNSIGAIVAVFLAQGLGETLEEISGKIGLDYILNIPDNLVKNGELKVDSRNQKSFRRFYRSAITKGGLDTTPLRKLLEQYIDEEEIRKKGKDLGLIAYNITEMKPTEVYLEDMEQGELINYVLASSAFPGFEKPQIAGRKYIDGGVFDSIPFAMAKSRGYKNIIVSDISGIGVKRRPDIEGVQTVYIKASVDMGGLLDFNREFLDRFSRLGYLDTMRSFGRFQGRRFFIRPEIKEEKRFVAFLEQPEINERLRAHAYAFHRRKKVETTGQAVQALFPKKVRHYRIWLTMFVDCAARVLSLEIVKTWSYEELYAEMTERVHTITDGMNRLDEKSRRRTERAVRRELNERRLLKTPYFYKVLADRYLSRQIKRPLNRLLDEVFPELPAGIFFLEVLKAFREIKSGKHPHR